MASQFILRRPRLGLMPKEMNENLSRSLSYETQFSLIRPLSGYHQILYR